MHDTFNIAESCGKRLHFALVRSETRHNGGLQAAVSTGYFFTEHGGNVSLRSHPSNITP